MLAWFLLVALQASAQTPASYVIADPATYASQSHATAACQSSYQQTLGAPAQGPTVFDVTTLATAAVTHGLPSADQTTLTTALNYVQHNPTLVRNQNYVAVADYTQPGIAKRLYVVSLKDGSVDTYPVGQGTGHVVGPSGSCPSATTAWTPDKPYPVFSNVNGTCLSATGCVLTSVDNGTAAFWGTYYHVHGLNPGNNDQDCNRDIWMHNDPRADFAGDSMGCFAIPQSEFTTVMSQIGGGAIVCTNP